MKVKDYDEKIKIIEEYINTKNDINEIKQKGAIYTPITITENMLSNLEKCYRNEYKSNIYENENLKWYDNSSGIGNIILIVYLKLMEGLSLKIPDYYKRKKHILEKMIYVSEINNSSIEKYKYFVNKKNKYNLNIYIGDSLAIDIKKIWGIDTIDIIIGNPPYQKENKKTNLSRGGTNNNLYIDFIKKSLELLKPSGYLVYIHPQNWRKINSNILNTFVVENDLLHLSLNYGGKLFKNVSVKTDFYVLKKNKLNFNVKTNIKCYDNKNNLIDESNTIISNIDFIPNIFNNEIKNIFEKINKYGEKRECIINSYCHKVREHVGIKSVERKYPLYNTSGNPFEYYSSKPHKDQYKKKVIMSSSGKLSPFYDDGKYGTTQDSMYFIVSNKSEGDEMVNILSSELYKFIIKICQWGNFRNEANLFTYIKYPVIDNSKEMTDKYIYDYFKLNQIEINTINNFL